MLFAKSGRRQMVEARMNVELTSQEQIEYPAKNKTVPMSETSSATSMFHAPGPQDVSNRVAPADPVCPGQCV